MGETKPLTFNCPKLRRGEEWGKIMFFVIYHCTTIIEKRK